METRKSKNGYKTITELNAEVDKAQETQNLMLSLLCIFCGFFIATIILAVNYQFSLPVGASGNFQDFVSYAFNLIPRVAEILHHGK